MNEKTSGKRGFLALEPTEHQSVAKRPAVQAAQRSRALAILKSVYGFDAFRGKQEEAVMAALAGRDVLVVMPTGGGKTLCYVIPALVQPGVCIVVSPLLALMQDQVANLRRVGVPAAQLSSSLPAARRETLLADLEALAGRGGSGGGGSGGGTPQTTPRVLLVTPELLAASSRFRSLLRRLYATRSLSLFAIDESHCISTWGHDFRPAYRQLQALRRDFPGVPIMALTATAASPVRDDICQQLRLSNPVRLLSSFNRPNISYTVRYLEAEQVEEVEAVRRLLIQRRDAAGGQVPCSIVYCLKRDTCEAVAARLRRDGLPAAPYHGQMRDGEKKEVLRQWQADEVPVVVATIAFGMGIDKAGVRLIVHYNLPRSLEGYYQEAGRAGRDGGPAESVVFYRRDARSRLDFVLEKDQERQAAAAAARDAAGSVPGGTSAGGGGRGGGCKAAVGGGGGGRAATESRPGAQVGAGAGDQEDAAAAALSRNPTAEEQARVQETAWEAFGRVVDWATNAVCRRRALLAHFGETAALGPCAGTGDGEPAGCDVCRDREFVEIQLKKLQQQQLEATAAGRRGAWGGSGRGGDDGESNMFAARGGHGEQDGREGRDEVEEGPSSYQAGRTAVQHSAEEVLEARAAAAAARAAAGGRVDDSYFAALEAKENEYERRSRMGAGDVVDRMLAGGSGGDRARGSGSSAPPPPPDASTRANAVAKLAAALGVKPGAAGLEQKPLRKLADAIEAEVYGDGLPRQQYLSRMAGLLSRAKAAPSPLALLPPAPVPATSRPAPTPGPAAGGGAGAASSPPAPLVPAAAAAGLLPDLLQAEVTAIEALLAALPPPSGSEAATVSGGTSGCRSGTQQQQQQQENLGSMNRGGGSGGGGGGVAQAVSRLRVLGAVSVTVAAVAAGGVGRRLTKLGKHGQGEVAEAARQAVASWKRQLPERSAAAAASPPAATSAPPGS